MLPLSTFLPPLAADFTGLAGFLGELLSWQVQPPTEDQVDGGSIMEIEEDSWKGLACLFKPQPKYVPTGRRFENVESEQEQEMNDGLLLCKTRIRACSCVT